MEIMCLFCVGISKTMIMIPTEDHPKLVLVFMPYKFDIGFNDLCTPAISYLGLVIHNKRFIAIALCIVMS